MNCKKCHGNCIKNGFQVNGKQRFYCKFCNLNQQLEYKYNAYKSNICESIVKLVINSCGIRDISRVLAISKTTVIKRILSISSLVKKPIIDEIDQIYEIDELYTKLQGKICWLTYAINRNTKQIIDFHVGGKTKENLDKVIKSVLKLNPRKIYTDKLNTYKNLIPVNIHSNRNLGTNTIERFNLNLRTHLKRLSRKTICFSKNLRVLEACILIYFWYDHTIVKIKKI